MTSAKGTPRKLLAYKLKSLIDKVDRLLYSKTKCDYCSEFVDDEAMALFSSHNVALAGKDEWLYICSKCCTYEDMTTLKVCLEIIEEYNLSGVDALIMIWGSFDNIPADMLL